jgi:hypothetical protein
LLTERLSDEQRWKELTFVFTLRDVREDFLGGFTLNGDPDKCSRMIQTWLDIAQQPRDNCLIPFEEVAFKLLENEGPQATHSALHDNARRLRKGLLSDRYFRPYNDPFI